MCVFFIGLFLATFQVACDAGPRGSFPALPAEMWFGKLGKYQVEKRQGQRSSCGLYRAVSWEKGRAVFIEPFGNTNFKPNSVIIYAIT